MMDLWRDPPIKEFEIFTDPEMPCSAIKRGLGS